MRPQTFLVSLALLASTAAIAAPPRNPADEPRAHHEDCAPAQLVTVLRDQVEWWARTAEPVALAGQFQVDLDAVETPPSRVAWRLVVMTLDGAVADERFGVTELEGGTGVGFVNFEGKDAGGHPLDAGLYVYRFESEGFQGSGGFLRVVASDDEPAPPVRDGGKAPLASSSNPSVPYSFYFGAEHAHTTYSDGGTPVATCTGSISSPHAGSDPASAFAKAKTGNVDWITVIEHNHLLDDACGTGCSSVTVVGRYQGGLSAAAAATTSTFVGIYGMEWGVISGGGHIALYDTTKLFSWEAYAEVNTPKSDYTSLYTTANNPAYQGASGATGAFCHPGTSDYGSFAQNAAGIAFMRGLAVISGPASSNATSFADAGTRYSGPKAGSDLYQYALQRGWRIGPEAHADNHCDNYGTVTRNRTVVLANGLSKASIMDAKKSRRFYASSDLNAQMFFGTADYAKVMGQQFTTSAATLDLLVWVNDPDGATVSSVTLWQGNPAAGSGSPTSLTMTSAGSGTYTSPVTVPATGEAYWYAYVALSNGAELFSAPIWVSKTSCSDTTAPSASVTAPTATTVSGTVTVTATATDDVGVTGMTLKVDGTTVATSSTGSVSYSWNTTGLAAGSSHAITATATDACGNVSPTATKSVTIAAAATYSISGNAGTSGATVTAGSASATSDASSSYNVSGLLPGTITVTPSKTGCTFSPASRSVTITAANVTGISFTATCSGGDVTLTSGVPVTGQSVAASAWKYYSIAVPSGATNLTLATTSATGDVDIYTQSGAKPTSSSYVCRPYTGSGNESCSATSPAATTWWLGVYGYAAASYTVTGTYTLGGTTYSISGNVGTPGATVTAGTKSATSDASSNYAISGLAAGTYTVTPAKSGCTFSPASKSVTIGSANVTGIGFTATCGSTPVTLFTDGFEGTGWSFANVSGTTGYWTLGASSTHPSATPHGGSKLAAFNSYTCAAGTQKRMYRSTGFAVASSYATVTLKLWMYHDTAYATSADKVQVQVSTNGTTWTNVGTAISRYSATAGWAQATIDLSAYKGQTVYLGFVGISGYGNDQYLDDVTVTAQ